MCIVASLFLQLLRWSLGRSRAKETSGLLERMSPNLGVTGGEDPQVALTISLVEDIGDSGRVSTIIEGIPFEIVGNGSAVESKIHTVVNSSCLPLCFYSCEERSSASDRRQ